MITYLRSRLTSWEWLLAVLVIILLITASSTTVGFTSDFNVQTSISLMAEKALMILPLALLVIAREIDISVASIAGLCAVSTGLVVSNGGSVGLAVVVALGVGALCGAINGFFVTVLGLPSLVVTLGTLAVYRGLCYVLLGGTPISDVPAELINFGNLPIPGTMIPIDIIPFIVLAPVFAIILHRTVVGRRIYAVGGNPDTAMYSGVRSARIRFALFVLSGALSAMAGVINIGRTSQAAPDAAIGFELDVITIVFLGGVSVLGGVGRMTGVYWALALVIALRSFLQLQNAGGYTQSTAVGLLLIGSLLISNIARRTSAALTRRRNRATALTVPASQLQ